MLSDQKSDHVSSENQTGFANQKRKTRDFSIDENTGENILEIIM